MLVFPLLLLAACVTTPEDIQYLNDRVGALDREVGELQQSMQEKIPGDVDSRLETVQASQAELGAEVDHLKGDLQGLTGRVEENSHLVKRAIERDTTEEDTIKASLSDLAERVVELEEMVKRLNEYLALESAAKAKRPPPLKFQPPKPRKEPQKPPPVVEKEPQSPEAELYDSTLAAYREGKYEEAISGFQAFLKKYPKSELADNAQFWVGEAYMALKQYEQAILAYQEVIKNYPKGNKVPNAMLRQALAFYEIKDKTSSRLLLKKIVRTYPNSTEAKIAKTKLKTMK